MTASRVPSLGPRGEGWVALQLVTLAAIAVAGLLLGGSWSGATPTALWVVGALLTAGGLVLVVAGAVGLQSSLSALPHPSDRAVLITSGLYARTRHPIYAGLVLASIGWGLLTGSFVALLLAAVLALILDLKARREEVRLVQRFPDYAAYAARTKKFIPGLY